MKYFRMQIDFEKFPRQWFLANPISASGEAIDEREFTRGHRYRGPVPVSVSYSEFQKKHGHAVALHFGGSLMPVVSTAVAEKLQRIAGSDIQRFPVIVNKKIKGYEILNVARTVKCVDEFASRAVKVKDRDRKLGWRYQSFENGLHLDAERIKERHIFRITGSSVEVIVSERVKRALQGVRNLGSYFKPIATVTAKQRKINKKAATKKKTIRILGEPDRLDNGTWLFVEIIKGKAEAMIWQPETREELVESKRFAKAVATIDWKSPGPHRISY